MSLHKCLLVGDGGTGKTSLIKRLATGEFSTRYSATVGYEVHHLSVYSEVSATKLDLQIWDVSGQTSSGSLLEEILNDAHCAIIIFDVTSRVTFNNVLIWYREIIRACGPNIPVVILGNKIDILARKIKIEKMLRKFPSSIKHYEISVKTKFNIEQPILWITTQLLQSLHTPIIEHPPTLEDFKIVGQELMDNNDAVQEAVRKPLPDKALLLKLFRHKFRRTVSTFNAAQNTE